MSPTLRQPTVRTCERCGRSEKWNADNETWEVVDNNVGSIYCIHEWDINGSFVPFEEYR